ncbi:branched-chain amino acid ABC transporter permease [Haloarcula pelagica]|uniref:branched-chain amino acid ABC transporter permease n=1 Tax=Haloarcula pelagica TaxID=3033389 RepID=UPI0024C37F9A|nr:branched-chain amino acid ABC transporter permease [Halomicroarcula sp. YJ-61-S]
MSYATLLVTVGIIVGIYALLAVGMNMHWGDTGLLNFAHAGFFAVGAYASTILTTPGGEGLLAARLVGFDLPIVFGLLAGTVLAAAVGVVIALTSVRLEGDYLAMVTLSAAEIIRLVITNESWLTSGAQGISDIPRPAAGAFPVDVGGVALGYDLFYLVLVLGILGASYAVFERLSGSPFGRVLHAIREDEDVPRALGKHTSLFKLKSFGLGAGIAGLAGGLWAHFFFAINPTMFLPSLTFSVWAAVIIGGAGSYGGAIAGTVFIVGIRQVTRFLPNNIPFSSDLPFIRLIIIGIALIAVLYYRPQGLLGDRERLAAGQSMEGE